MAYVSGIKCNVSSWVYTVKLLLRNVTDWRIRMGIQGADTRAAQ